MTIRVPGFEWSDAVSLPLPTNLGGDDDDNNDNDDRDDSVTSPRAIVRVERRRVPTFADELGRGR